jgi:hypothetical protein
VRIDLLDDALGFVVEHEVLHHDDIAWHGDCEVGLGGDDQAEGLEIGGDVI